MEKNVGSLVVLAAIVCLLLGGTVGSLVGYQMAPEEKVITEEKVVEVPVEKVVNRTVEVSVPDTSLLLQKAKQTFIDEKLEDLRVCDGNRYDLAQISVNDLGDDYAIYVGDETEVIQFGIELKYLDEDVDEKCYTDHNVSVLYEVDEEPEITVA